MKRLYIHLNRALRNSRTAWITGIFTAIVAMFCIPALAGLPANNAVPGGIAVVKLDDYSDRAPLVRFGNRRIMVMQNRGQWHAIVGLSNDLLPGNYLLTVSGDGQEISTRPFRVKPLSAARAQRTMSLPDNLSGLTFDSAATSRQRESGNEQWYSVEPSFEFFPVVDSRLLIPFGLLVNPKMGDQYIKHARVTYFCPANALIYAPAAGRVDSITTDPEDGIVVLINHGQGLVSMLSHVGETVVETGQEIRSGELVGVVRPILDRQNGRVDWGLFLNGNLIDPLQFSSSG